MKLLDLTLGLIVFLASLLILYLAKGIIIPIVFSVLVVYVIVGGARMLQATPWLGKRLGIGLAYLLSLCIIVALSLGVGYSIFKYLGRVVSLVPQYQDSMLDTMQSVASHVGIESELTWTTLRSDILSNIKLQSVVTNILNSLSSLVASLIMIGLLAAFLFIEKLNLSAKLQAITSSQKQLKNVQGFLHRINARLGAYLALKTLLSFLVGIVSWLIMWFMGLELAVFWGALMVVLNFIPYLGSIISVALPVSFAIFQIGDLATVLTLFGLLVLTQFIIGNLLDPYVMGNSLNLSPFAIMLSLMVWGGLWGVPGAFLAVPCTACINIVLSEFNGTRWIAILLSTNGKLS